MEGADDFVCKRCLERYCTRIELITDRCYDRAIHQEEPRVKVTWSGPNKRLERLDPGQSVCRSIPGAFYEPATGRFRLCSGGESCDGDLCTSAHSLHELKTWNTQLEKCMTSSSGEHTHTCKQICL